MDKFYYLYGDSPKIKWERKQYYKAIELGLPIPCTGKYTHGGYFRSPKFMSVYRQQDIDSYNEKEYDIKLKRLKLPPNNWDDEYFSYYNPRNWKKYRNYQWKGK